MAESPNKSRRWTDTDDAVVLAFPPAEAAAILGRTLAAIYARRSLKDLGGANTDRKPRQRLRRDYFRDGQGDRAEAIPQRQPRKCRFCPRVAHGRGLCKGCHARVMGMVEKGYVTREIAEQCWLGPRTKALPK